jgi:hypothetical protein
MKSRLVIAQRRVDGIARGTGDVGHHQALLTQHPVDERRLAHVRAADHRNAQRIRHLFGASRDGLHHHVEQIARACRCAPRPAPDRRRRVRRTRRSRSRGSSTLLATSTHGLLASRSRSSTRRSLGCNPAFASTTSSSRSASSMAVSTCLRISTSIGMRGSSVSPPVSTSQKCARPVGLGEVTITRGARLVAHDGRRPADDAVEEGGLADVRAPDDGDDWETHAAGCQAQLPSGTSTSMKS